MTSFRELYRGGAQRIRIKLEAVARSRTQLRPVRFRGGHFEDVIILLCVRWYLRYSLSYRDLEEMMMERAVDSSTFFRRDRVAPAGIYR